MGEEPEGSFTRMPTEEDKERVLRIVNNVINIVMSAYCAYLGVTNLMNGESLRGALLLLIAFALIVFPLIPLFSKPGR